MDIKDWSEVAREYIKLMPDAEKIGIVTDSAETSSGVGRVARALTKQIAEEKDVILYTMNGRISGEKKRNLKLNGVDVKEIQRNSATDPREIKRIKEMFEEDDLDGINSHGFYLAMAAAVSDVKTVKTYHAHITKWSEVRKDPVNWLKWVLEEAISIWLAEERVSISKYAARQMRRIYLSSSIVIYNGIDKNRFKIKETDYRLKLGLSKDDFVVGTLSALKPYKNQEKTLELFADNHADKENAFLIVGGSGPQEEYLKEKVSELGIADKTIFLGYVPDENLVDFYNSIDVFIYPSEWEGFGLPPLEAKLCGCEIKITNNNTALSEHDV